MKSFLSTLLLGLLLHLANYGQVAKAILDSNVIRIGEQVRLTLVVQARAQDTIQWPELADTLSANIDIVDRSEVITRYDTADITIKYTSQQFLITAFDSGYYPIEPFQFIVGDNALLTDPLLLMCHTVEIDTSKGFADIQAPYQAAFSLMEWLEENWQMVGGIAGILAILTALLIYLIKRKPEEIAEVINVEPTRPAHDIALEKLDELAQKKLWQSGKVKDYHVLLSDIVREYLEKRFDVLALEQTSAEIIQNLRLSPIENDLVEKLSKSLILSDLVKFAKEQPLASENEQCLKLAYELVETTKIVEEVLKKEVIDA